MNMYRLGKPAHGPPPFGPPTPHGSTFRLGGPCGVPPPEHLPLGPCGPFLASAPDSHFLHNRPPREHFIRTSWPNLSVQYGSATCIGYGGLCAGPRCSSFSSDHSTVIALGGRQQIVPPAEPPHTQVPQWNPTPVERHPPDNSDRASEEFLRCIAANKPLPDYLKGNMAINLADAFKSANVLKEAVKSDPEFRKHVTRSKSRSRSRSRGKSRGKSRTKSHVRSKSRARSRSRGRSKSRARGKSQARSKNRVRSRSRSRSESKNKGHIRSKSRVRRSKSRSSSGEKSRGKDKNRRRSPNPSCSSSNNLTGASLLEGLKLVMNSKELEERLPTLKDAILTIQASGESKKVHCVPDERRHPYHDSHENSASLENDSMLLPHDRVGSDFSWLQAQSQEDSAVPKADELEDEESFLYGNEDSGEKQTNESSTIVFDAFSQIGEHAKPLEIVSPALGNQHHQNNSIFRSFGDLVDLKQPLQMTSSRLASANLDSSECDKIKNILKSLGTANISEIMVKMKGQKEGKQLSPGLLSSDPAAAGLALPSLSNPNVRQALESLQSLIKATKEKRTKGDGSGTSQASSDTHKADDNEERKREKQARITKMESLAKELQGLLKQDGMSFLTPVIGFYCQKCDEFIGDLTSAESHAAIHCHSNSNSQNVQMDMHAGESKGQSHYFSSSNQHPHHSDRSDHRDCSYHRNSGEHKNHRNYERDWRDKRDHTNIHDSDHRSHRSGQENISLKEEMRKERMLITVSRGLTSPPNVRVKEEVKKEDAIGSHNTVKVEDSDSKGKSSKDSREKDKVKDESSDSSEDDKGKTSKAKSPKKKKKKKEKKKKKGNKP